MDTTMGLRFANTSPDVAAFSERNPATSGDPAGPANSLGTPLNNVEHFRHHRSGDEKLSPEKREAALVQITGVRPNGPSNGRPVEKNDHETMSDSMWSIAGLWE